MTTEHTPTMSLKDAYLAMYYFVREYWERGGRRDGSVTLLLNALGPAPNGEREEAIRTDDPAFWHDWLAAVKRARAEGFPKEL